MSSAPSPRLHSLPLLGSGKVRDNYAVGEDRLLMVTSDRLSAFDVIMAEPIPDKTSAHNNTLEFNGKRNLDERHYIFANTSWYRDRIANLSHRLAAAVGRGYQVTTTPNDDWSVFAGLGYSEDRYTVPTIVADQLRTRYGRAELTLGTESHHQLTDTTTAHQRLVFTPRSTAITTGAPSCRPT